MTTNTADASAPLAHIQDAIAASYDPRTPNEQRQEALRYLESLMNSNEAPQYGYNLVNDTSLPPQARLFGLTLLENSLVRRWSQHTTEEAETIRQWIINLAQFLRPEDPSYLRLKIAALWVVLAQRTWADTWTNMDAMLQELWDMQASPQQMACNRTFALYIIETLSENICVREDPIAMLRQSVLGQSLNDILITDALYEKISEEREHDARVRHGTQGWLLRMSIVLESAQAISTPGVKDIVLRALEALKPTMTWISLDAVVQANCIDSIFQALAYGDDDVRTAAIELLLVLFLRPLNAHFLEQFTAIHRSAISPSRIEMLKRIFTSLQTDPDDIDESKYTAQKKLSEVIARQCDAVNSTKGLFDNDDHAVAFYQFAIDICKSNSLLVSIPVLHSLASSFQYTHPYIRILRQGAHQMFDTCVERLIKFDQLPKETEHPILTYLHEDFETLPEMHAFLGNYRRYALRTIENISVERPIEAIEYMLQQTATTFKAVEALGGSYDKHAIPVVQLEANASAVRGGLAGFRRWLSDRELGVRTAKDPDAINAAKTELQRETAAAEAALSEHCMSLAGISTEHPDVARCVCQLMVDIMMHHQKPPSQLVRGVTQHILKLKAASHSGNEDLQEATKQLHASRLNNVQLIALSFANVLYEDRDQIFELLEQNWQDSSLDDKTQWGFKGVLLVIIQRASTLAEQERLQRLQPMLQPVAEGWSTPQLCRALDSFPNFLSLVGLEGMIEYVVKARFNATEDWSKAQLDADGAQIRTHCHDRLIRLPLRMTTTLLAATTEGLKENTVEHRIGVALWTNLMPMILPNILSLLSHATSFNNERTWANASAEFQAVMRKMLVDRFWQSGISTETRDEFTARISGSSNTYEGFASAVRGTPRQIRDACYHIIHGLTRFEHIFFNVKNLPNSLAKALYEHAHCLSTHHLQRLVSLTERLVSRCPLSQRRSFLPPLIILSFRCFRSRLSEEWEAISANQISSGQAEGSEDLSDEMRADSVVRATTYAFVTFTHRLLSAPLTVVPPMRGQDEDTMTLLLTSAGCEKEIMDFLVASLSMQDSRCVTISTQTLKSIATWAARQQNPAIVNFVTYVRQRLLTDTLQTAIVSLNLPHFVDIHKDLASLIACILHHFGAVSQSAHALLSQLQGIDTAMIEPAIAKIVKSNKEREQRAIVLDLLAGIRGVRISELGKVGIGGNRPDAAAGKKAAHAKWLTSAGGDMDVESAGIVRGNTPPEGGLGDLFGA